MAAKPEEKQIHMDTFVDSSWYYARYCSPRYNKAPFEKEETNYWMNVDQYIGGIEHAILHLLYFRFFNKVMKDLGLLKASEPFERLLTQGMVIKDGFKMSKSKGNVVDPDEMIKKYGADALRIFILFASPPEKDLEWSEKGIEGSARFINRLWKFVYDNIDKVKEVKNKKLNIDTLNAGQKELYIFLNKTIKKIDESLNETFHFNTSIALVMELMNLLAKYQFNLEADFILLNHIIKNLLIILNPFVPFITEEIWQEIDYDKTILEQPWPEYDKNYVQFDVFTLVLQVNGKIRNRLEVELDTDEEKLKDLALKDEKVKEWIQGKEIIKIVPIKNKLVNIVVKWGKINESQWFYICQKCFRIFISCNRINKIHAANL